MVAGRNERGLYKMICEGDNERIVGVHMIGPEAPEIMQAAAVAVKAGLTKARFRRNFRNPPDHGGGTGAYALAPV